MLRAIVCVTGVIVFSAMGVQAETSGCEASGGLAYVCGLANAEDLVSVPGSAWVLSSGMAPGGGIYLIDGVERTWTQMYTGAPQQIRHDKTTFGF